uniref:Uncharacterized protein n=1 Tax=Picea glauca TaxID=3330 RepID=A0A101M1L5_PICGL|nr:hypothetical protein ABT39_MTgene3933 [Picea glauca]
MSRQRLSIPIYSSTTQPDLLYQSSPSNLIYGRRAGSWFVGWSLFGR